MEPDISSLAALLAEPARSRILMALADGRGLPATELARRAGVTPQTASSHLSKMTEGHLLQLIPQGRHRYYRLANSRVAEFLESMAAIAPLETGRALGPDQGGALQLARSCYKHLAGSLGVGLTKALVERKILREEGRDYEVTRSGAGWFEDFGIDTNALRKSGRVFARQCLDWSERRNHLAGALGTALTERLFELEWIKRVPASRAIQVTAPGRTGLRHRFGLKWESDR
ncbi:MAG: winged helix-turn-helix domain-containing protein [Chthoniobacterales bacterium]